jgi:hypothetical protein
MNKFIRLFNTIKYLKSKQIIFRLFYFSRSRFRKLIGFEYKFLKESYSTSLKLTKFCDSYSFYHDKEFDFLNLSKKFENKIDWNYSEYGKLWTYNLTYFEYLKEKSDVSLIYDFINNIENIKDGLDPFPISLRGINWIKFLSYHNIKDKNVDDSLYAQYYILMNNLEYHLLGNHLLENGFSLLFGAYHFQDEKLYKKAKNILQSELDEQILDDGGHFELSPMYHQIMLFRVLDCINLVHHNSWKSQELLKFLTNKAELMLGWLENMTFRNGNTPLLNDNANCIAPTSKELFKYATDLKLNIEKLPLNGSGYKKIDKDKYECIVDIGHIGPDYIPGHAHSDTFNFELYINEKPFIVDSGLSTYETNERRTLERSTSSHNTVEVNGTNQSEVWAGFRVANRAYVTDVVEGIDSIKATHDGYKKKFGVVHAREWIFEEDKIIINDSLNKESEAVAMLHFHPKVTEEDIRERVIIKNSKLNIKHYSFAPEFNKLEKALVVEMPFKKDLTIEIKI